MSISATNLVYVNNKLLYLLLFRVCKSCGVQESNYSGQPRHIAQSYMFSTINKMMPMKCGVCGIGADMSSKTQCPLVQNCF